MKWKQGGSGVDRRWQQTNRDMSYEAGNVTQCEADARDGRSTQRTAGCVWALPTAAAALGRADVELHASSGLNEQNRTEQNRARPSIHVNCLINTHNTQSAGKHSVTAGWPLCKAELNYRWIHEDRWMFHGSVCSSVRNKSPGIPWK